MKELQTRDPLTASIVWQGAPTPLAAVPDLFTRAAEAQRAWRQRPEADRVALAERLVPLLESQAEALTAWIGRETGKPRWEAAQEVRACIGKVALTIGAWQAARCQPTGLPEAAEIGAWPLGVVVVLGPYNFPCHLPHGQILPALLAGNAVIFKPSERCLGSGVALQQIYLQAGFPPQLLQLALGGGELGAALVDEPACDAVFFTGSRATGRRIHAQLAGRPEVQLALEMGGNNPLVVWPPADPRRAARQVLLSAYLSAGQRCTCARRWLVPDDAFGEALVQELLSQIRRLRTGAWDATPAPFMGAVIDDRMCLAAGEEIARLRRLGAVELAAWVSDGHPRLWRPALLDCSAVAVADLRDEEFFVPLLQLRRCRDYATALQEAARTRYGLAAGLLCEDAAAWQQFRQAVPAGVLMRNRQTTAASGAMPFGGLKESGNHRPAGVSMIDACFDPVACLQVEQIPEPEAQPGLGEEPV